MMKLEANIVSEIRDAFGDVCVPVFEKFLEQPLYASPDDAPVNYAKEIYPCEDLGEIDRNTFDEVQFMLSLRSYFFIVPRVLVYLLENETGMQENFTTGFMMLIDIGESDRGMRNKIKKFYSQLDLPKRDAICAAYEQLSKNAYVDEDEVVILKNAIEFLKKKNEGHI